MPKSLEKKPNLLYIYYIIFFLLHIEVKNFKGIMAEKHLNRSGSTLFVGVESGSGQKLRQKIIVSISTPESISSSNWGLFRV